MYISEPVTYGWEHIYEERESPYEGYVESLEEVQRLITAYEISTITKFVRTRCSGKLFGVVRFDRKCRIWWEDIRDTKGVVQKYDGTPFVIMGSRMMSCVFGPDNNKNFKVRAQEEKVRLSLAGEDTKKRRTMKTPSKKLGCPSGISVRHIVRFPRHRIDYDDVTLRRQAAATLKEDFADGVRLPYEERFYVRLPEPISHRDHPEGDEALAKDSLDERIIAKIHELVDQGIDKPTDVQESLNVFVADELFKGAPAPPASWRRFYPKKNDIRNQIYRAKGLKPSRHKDELALAIQAVGGLEDGGVGGASAGNVEGNTTTSSDTTSAAVSNTKPQLNRLRYQCRDKLKLLSDLTYICYNPQTLQAIHGVLSTLHSEIWSELQAARGGDDTAPIKAEDVAAAAARAKAAAPDTDQSEAAAASQTLNGSTSTPGESALLSKLSWPATTGLLNKQQKKRGRKRKEDTVVDTTNQYARSYISRPRDRSRNTLEKLKQQREVEPVEKKPKIKKKRGGPKRKPGRPRKLPPPKQEEEVILEPDTKMMDDEEEEVELVTLDVASEDVSSVGDGDGVIGGVLMEVVEEEEVTAGGDATTVVVE